MAGVSIDRSLAFTALLELSPDFGKTEVTEAAGIISRFLTDYRAEIDTKVNMLDFAREWLANGGLKRR